MKRNMRQNGITLIALVITIIVLLILAGVALSVVFNGGLIDKSQNAVDSYGYASKNEADKLSDLERRLNEYFDGNGETVTTPPVDYDPQQVFTYQILTTATAKAGDIDGIDSVTTLADNSETLKIADNTMGTVKITGYNYDYIFKDVEGYVSGELPSCSASDSDSGSSANNPLVKRIKEKYATLVIPGTVKLNAQGKYDENGTEYKVIEITRYLWIRL